MTRVAILCPNYHPYTCGVGDNSMRMGQELLAAGIETRVFAPGKVEAHPEAPALPVSSLTGTSPRAVAASARRVLLEWRPAFAILQYVPQMWGATRFGSPAAPLLCASLRRAGIRVVAVGHELYLPWALRPDLLAGGALMRLQLGALLQSVDRLALTTESRLDTVRAVARVAGLADKLAYFPIGSNALPVLARPAPGRFDVGVFSTLAAGKAYESVIDAFAEVSKTVPHARLRLIGDLGDPSHFRHRALLHRIRSHSAGDRISVTGKLHLSEVADAVAALDVFVFPMTAGATTRSSTLPLALGCGVPVVAMRGAETGSFFSHRETVFLTPDLSSAALAQAILSLHEDAALRECVGRGGRALFERELSWPILRRRMLGLFELVQHPG